MSRKVALVVAVLMVCGLRCGGGADLVDDAIVGLWQMYAASETLDGPKTSTEGSGYSGWLKVDQTRKFSAAIETPQGTFLFAGTWAKRGQEYIVFYSGQYAGQQETFGLAAGEVYVFAYQGASAGWVWFHE